MWVLPKDLQDGLAGDERKCKVLKKEVQGTKAAPREWYITVSRALEGLGLSRSRIDNCLFLAHKADEAMAEASKDGEDGEARARACDLVAILSLHVDDILMWILESELSTFIERLHEAGIATRYITVLPEEKDYDLLGKTYRTTPKGTTICIDKFFKKRN